MEFTRAINDPYKVWRDLEFNWAMKRREEFGQAFRKPLRIFLLFNKIEFCLLDFKELIRSISSYRATLFNY